MKLKIEANCFYKTRQGVVLGPFRKDGLVDGLWRVKKLHQPYQDDGTVPERFESPHLDLVRKVDNPHGQEICPECGQKLKP